MKEIKEREREGEIGEKLEKLDVLGTRGCVLEVVLLGNEGQAAFALARANCFVILLGFWGFRVLILLRRNNLHKYAQISNSFFF